MNFIEKIPKRILRAAFLALSVGAAAAQSGYPEQTVRILVGFTPGVAPDITARLLAAVIEREIPQWASVIRKAGIKASD